MNSKQEMHLNLSDDGEENAQDSIPDAGCLAIPRSSNRSSWTLCQGFTSSSDSEDEDGTANTMTIDTETIKKEKTESKSEDLSSNTACPAGNDPSIKIVDYWSEARPEPKTVPPDSMVNECIIIELSCLQVSAVMLSFTF